jgi:hypothetical protein
MISIEIPEKQQEQEMNYVAINYIDFSYTKWIVLSSCIFFINVIYSIYLQLPLFYTLWGVMTTCLSVNYWRNATYGIRRDLDVFFARISVVLLNTYGIYVIGDPIWRLMYICITIIYLILFRCSEILREPETIKPYWIFYHFFFHTFLNINVAIAFYWVYLKQQ